MTFKCTQKTVLVSFHSHSALTTDKTLQFVTYKSCKVKFNNVTISFIYKLYKCIIMIIVIKFGCEREVVRSCRLDTRNMNPHFDLSIEDSF